MKKIFLAIAILFAAMNCVAQYNFSSRTFEVESVDEWGDKTGNINFGVWCDGYFRNCATDKDVASLKFVGNTKDDCMIVVLYEYNNKTSDAIKGFKLINEKDELLFSASTIVKREWKRKGYVNYNDLISFLRNSETIKVELYGSASTHAYFKIDNPTEFADLIEKYNNIEPKKENRRIDDVYWYSYH